MERKKIENELRFKVGQKVRPMPFGAYGDKVNYIAEIVEIPMQGCFLVNGYKLDDGKILESHEISLHSDFNFNLGYAAIGEII